ncbi:MAG: hypothetical protein ACLTZM_10220 [Ruminococcus sp.]
MQEYFSNRLEPIAANRENSNALFAQLARVFGRLRLEWRSLLLLVELS